MKNAHPLAPETLILLKDINQHYSMDERRISIFERLNWSINKGDSCGVLGASGCGKSTFLNLVGMLDRPASGSIYFSETDALAANEIERAELRNKHIGFIFQSFNLLPRLSALQNVALPLAYRGIARHRAQEQAMAQLRAVGLLDRATHRPAELSGGQRQRVAIARALVGQPALILADEPTGNLDGDTARRIIDLLLDLNKRSNVTLVVVTHDAEIAARFNRQYHLRAGQLVEMPTPSAQQGCPN